VYIRDMAKSLMQQIRVILKEGTEGRKNSNISNISGSDVTISTQYRRKWWCPRNPSGSQPESQLPSRRRRLRRWI
jgi:hypothetical protein